MNYDRYFEVTKAISDLEQEKKVLSAAILQRLQEEKTERVTTDFGVLSVKTRTSWKYIPAVKTRLDAIQKEAQESGEAEKVETAYLSTSLR